MTGDMQAMVNVAVMHLHQWTTEHWGDEVELVEDSAQDPPGTTEGAARPSPSTTTADGGREAASTERPTTTAAAVNGGRRREPRRRLSLPQLPRQRRLMLYGVFGLGSLPCEGAGAQ